jgi:hypothetical protein
MSYISKNGKLRRKVKRIAMNESSLKRFIDAIAPLTKAGFHPYGLLAHAWLETDGFINAIGSKDHKFNFWSMKVPRSWKRQLVREESWTPPIPYVVLSLNEYYEDDCSRISQRSVVDFYLDFKTIDQAINCYAKKIFRSFPRAVDGRFTPKDFFDGLCFGDELWCVHPPKHYHARLMATLELIEKNLTVRYHIGMRMKEYQKSRSTSED